MAGHEAQGDHPTVNSGVNAGVNTGGNPGGEPVRPAPPAPQTPPVRFEAHPEGYRHWRLEFPPEYAGAVARLVLDVRENEGMRPGYPLKLNSYDLGVDIELADAITRIRFEHPAVKAVVFVSGKDRIFCSGANIYMLGSSTHAFKVNFCKFTNETRLALEDMSAETGVGTLAALAGTASGGGYELAIACDEIALQDDGSSAVSFPEAPLLGVLPGTGGLTRLVDKRKVRRDLADAFSTVAEGVRGKRAIEWGLVDEAPSKKDFDASVKRRLDAMVTRSKRRPMKAVQLEPLGERRHVSVVIDARARTASLTIRAPEGPEPQTPDELASGTGSNACCSTCGSITRRWGWSPSARPATRSVCSPSTRCSRSTGTTAWSARCCSWPSAS
jgi:benzoyl-CoA-dihydrodiol lyase